MNLSFEDLSNKINNDCPTSMVELSNIVFRDIINHKKNLLKYLLMVFLIVIIIDFIVITFILNNDILGMVTFVILSFISIYVIMFFINQKLYRNEEKFISLYKNEVILKILQNEWPDINYTFGESIPNNDYKKEFNELGYKKFIPLDYFKVDSQKLEFVFVNLEEYDFNIKDYDYKTFSKYSLFLDHNFSGIEGKKILNKSIPFAVDVTYTRATKDLLGVGVKDLFITTNNTSFNGYYDVLSDNRILINKFLTDEFMNNIVNIIEKFNYSFEFGILNNELYFRIPLDRKTLITRNYDKCFNQEEIVIYYNLFNFIDNITKYISYYIEKGDLNETEL